MVPALSDWRLFMVKTHKMKKALLMSMVIMLLLALPQTVFAAEGTEGTELQVLQPQQLEIQLGTDWAGVEFQLKTDAGLYPGTIPVGEDGVLRLEIGGSTAYILTCLNSGIPAPDTAQAPATEGTSMNTTELTAPEEEPESAAVKPESQELSMQEEEESGTIAGIPVLHLALFGGGLVIAVAALVAMRLVSRRHAVDADYEEDEGE